MRIPLTLFLATMLGGCVAIEAPIPPKPRVIVRIVERPPLPLPNATCDPAKPANCSVMASCAEAMHYLETCAPRFPQFERLDGGLSGKKNGIACENLCGGNDPKAMCTRVSNAPHFMSGGRLSRADTPALCAPKV